MIDRVYPNQIYTSSHTHRRTIKKNRIKKLCLRAQLHSLDHTTTEMSAEKIRSIAQTNEYVTHSPLFTWFIHTKAMFAGQLPQSTLRGTSFRTSQT